MFRDLSKGTGLNLQLSGIEVHNAIGIGEKYHGALNIEKHTGVFLKVREENPRLYRETDLCISIKAVNDTMGPSVLVPTLLVYSCLTSYR